MKTFRMSGISNRNDMTKNLLIEETKKFIERANALYDKGALNKKEYIELTSVKREFLEDVGIECELRA